MSSRGLGTKVSASSMADSPVPTEQDYVPTAIERTHDVALDFLRARDGTVNAKLHTNPVYARRLRRKVDKLVMPLLWAVYGVTFLDKVILNVRPLLSRANPPELADQHRYSMRK